MKRLLVAIALLLAARSAAAQPYDLSWWTVDGGGTTNASGGAYTLWGTTGQPDAGGPVAGSPYTLHSGFWAIIGSGGGGPQADLSVTIADSPDPVPAGSTLTYTIQAANAGPTTSPSAVVAHTLPLLSTLVSASPGCVSGGSQTVICTLGAMAPGTGATLTVTVLVSSSTVSSLVSSVSIDGPVADPNTANDFDAETTAVTVARADAEIVHGTRLVSDLAASGGLPDLDTFRISQKPYTSYEVVLDAASGDIGLASGPALERISASGTTILQSSVPVGSGFARSLRFRNDTSSPIDDQRIRVRSLGCSTGCGSDDVYRLRGWETTGAIARFNNSASQVTVVILQNRGAAPLAGRVYFWSAAGAILHQEPLGLAGWGSVSVNTSTIPSLAGQGGSLTVVHDGPFGILAGKAVALEPASGHSFDSLLELRLR